MIKSNDLSISIFLFKKIFNEIDSDPILGINITTYRKLLSAKEKKISFENKEICLELDYISEEAIEELKEGEIEVIGIIKEGEEFFTLSILKNYYLNENNIRFLTQEITKRIKNKNPTN